MAAVLRKHTKIVNSAIKSMGIDPAVCTDENSPNVWKLHRGEAQVIIVLQDSTIYHENIVPTISIMSPILKAPAEPPQRLKLFTHILEVNHKLTTETFSLSNDWVVLSSTYYLEDITQHEIRQMLDSLSFHAQHFLEKWKA